MTEKGAEAPGLARLAGLLADAPRARGRRTRACGCVGARAEKEAGAPALAGVAGLLADETRAACLLALLDGRAWTAGELARAAGVAASTLREHQIGRATV